MVTNFSFAVGSLFSGISMHSVYWGLAVFGSIFFGITCLLAIIGVGGVDDPPPPLEELPPPLPPEEPPPDEPPLEPPPPPEPLDDGLDESELLTLLIIEFIVLDISDTLKLFVPIYHSGSPTFEFRSSNDFIHFFDNPRTKAYGRSK